LPRWWQLLEALHPLAQPALLIRAQLFELLKPRGERLALIGGQLLPTLKSLSHLAALICIHRQPVVGALRQLRPPSRLKLCPLVLEPTQHPLLTRAQLVPFRRRGQVSK
jgi:hypothetical protein